MRSTLTERMPCRRQASMIASVCSTVCTRLTACLHRRVEVLHAQARAVEADRRELGDVAGRQRSRIELDRDFAIARFEKGEIAGAACRPLRAAAPATESSACRRRSEAGRPRGRGRTAPRSARFAVQACEIGLATRAIARDDAVAAAVEARAATERDVHVHGERPRNRVAVGDATACRSSRSPNAAENCGAVGYDV